MKRHALFVGINDYADPTIQNLRCAVNDATELAGLFLHRARFDASEALLNPGNRDEVLNHVNALTDGLKQDDVFLFFFAGHGFSVKDGHVLVCSRDSYNDVRKERCGLPIDMLDEKTIGSFDRVFLLDACRTDMLAGGRGSTRGMTKRDRDLIFRPAERIQPSDGGRLSILCSCDEGQSAGELVSESHGLFSLALIEELKDVFQSGRSLEISDAFQEEIGTRMRRFAHRAGIASRQRPQKAGPPIRLLDGTSVEEPEEDASPGKRRTSTRRRRGTAANGNEADRDLDERIREEAERRSRSDDREAGEPLEFRVGKVPFVLRWCPPGTIRVVDHVWADVAPGVREAVETRERLELVKGFWMGETEVTQALWTEVMGGNPSRNRRLFGGMRPNHPVDGVSWDDCQKFIVALGHRPELADSGLVFRLPSHLEWEYAARAGFTNWPDGADIDRMGWMRWSKKKSHRVKTANPNAWGLYDLFGNAMEWCRDGTMEHEILRPFLSNRCFDFVNVFSNEHPDVTGREYINNDRTWYGLRLSAAPAAEGRFVP